VRRYQLIDQEKAHHTVSRLARVLGVARAGYYAWSSRPASVRTLADRALPEQIRQLHARSRGTDGPPRGCTPSCAWAWTSTWAANGSPG
jgi:putative transposase